METLKWNMLQIHDWTLIIFIHCMMWVISKMIKFFVFTSNIIASGAYAYYGMVFIINAYGWLIKVDNNVKQEEARYFDFDERSLWRTYKYLWHDQWK